MRSIKSVLNILNKYSLNNDAYRLLKYRRKIMRGGKLISYYYKIKYNKICLRNNSFIPISAQIGDNIVFPHGLAGIFISQKAIIGDNCVIFHQVTIGSNNLKDSNGYGAPIIGNNVYIEAGAKIIGNVKIGDNVRIGANAVIVNDIPANATVVLDNSRIILHAKSKNNEFVSL